MINGDDEFRKTLEASKRIDPGPPPWCPNCGAPAQATLALPQGFPNPKKIGVCAACGIIGHPEVTREGEMLPFLFHVSDLRPGIPPPVLHVQRQIRAKIRGTS
jgi:hypothetical protein